MNLSRRKFVKDVSIATASIPFLYSSAHVLPAVSDNEDLDIHIFSKHLQFLDYKACGEMAAEMGFSGIDLTVRPKGHVLPESVLKDLPKAVTDIEKAGSRCKMITTSIESVKNQLDKDIITAAAGTGVKYYRTNWFKYAEDLSMEESLKSLQQEIKSLGDYNKDLNIVGCYQNHAGTAVGASFWEIRKLLETADSRYFGTQYDIRHAMAEGGQSWVNGLRLLKDNIKVIALKDFKWGKADGKWQTINVPVGEGMVDFTSYFKLLKKYKINVPVSLHLEYPLGGAESGSYEISVDKKIVFDAMIKDLKAVRKLWKEA